MSIKSGFLVTILALLPLCSLPAVGLYVAPLPLQDETGGPAAALPHPEADLVRQLDAIVTVDVLDVQKSSDPSDTPVRSFLDAARLCESHGYTYLLYGFVKRSEFSLYAEVKLLNAEKKEVAVSFFNSDGKDHYDRLMHDLAARIVDYFYVDVGLKPGVKRVPARNLLSFPLSLGYWSPADGTWNPVLSGLGSVTLGLRFIPVSPLFLLFSREWDLSFGLDAEYALGMNQPSQESFFLHSLRFRLPVELNAHLGGGHVVGLGVGPLLQVDIMNQDRRYASAFSDTAATGGVSINAFYRYAASSLISIGLSTVIDVAFYNQRLVTISPRLFILFSPWSDREEKPHE